MKTEFYKEDEVLLLVQRDGFETGGTLRHDSGVNLYYAAEDSEEVTQLDVLWVSRFLPLCPERGYDAAADALTLGDKPDADYRVVDNGDFVSYLQWFDDEDDWDVVALDIRQASRHLAKAIAALPQPLNANSP